MIRDTRILVVTPFPAWPLSNGSITRTHYFAQHLAQANQVFLAHRQGGSAEARQVGCVSVPTTSFRYAQILSPRLLYRLSKTVREQGIELILSSHFWSGLHGALLKKMMGIPFILDNHNVEFERFHRVQSPLWPAVKLLERGVCRSADEIVSVSDVDRRKLIAEFGLDPDRVYVLPNGADVEALLQRQVDAEAVYRQLGLFPSRYHVLFFGNFGYPPNRQALSHLRQHVLPAFKSIVSDFCLVVAGAGLEPANLTEEKVQILGFVEDLVALIKSVDLVVAPLTAGSGTRLKILESVACGQRVVSTSIGAEGLEREAFGDMLHVSDDWGEFAQTMARLLPRPKPVTELPAPFCQLYAWPHIVSRLRFPQRRR